MKQYQVVNNASVQITSPKMKNSVNIASVNSGSSNSIMGNSAYIVLEPAVDSGGHIIQNQYTGNTFMTEEAAAIHMGDQDYITVYAKVNNRKQAGNPSISYKVETHNSSAAKIALKTLLQMQTNYISLIMMLQAGVLLYKLLMMQRKYIIEQHFNLIMYIMMK